MAAGPRVRIGTVWDRTVDVLRGRADIMAQVALLAIYLPAVASNAASAYAQASAGSAANAAAGLLVMAITLVVMVLSIWGQLTLLAIATHPATDRTDAARQATGRLLPALGLVVVLLLVFVLFMLPVVVVLARAGVDFTNPAWMQALPADTGRFVGLYTLVFTAFALWFSARIVLVNAVVLNERRGLGAIARSFSLTQGLTWRIIGLVLLFVTVLLVALMAAQGISALLFRVVLGADATATIGFLASSVGALVTTAMTVVAAAFTAQLYVAATGEREVAPLSR